MAAKAPWWEIHKSDRKVTGKVDGITTYSTQPFWAVLKGKNGRKVVTTETYRNRAGARKAIAVVDPDGKFEVRDYSK